MQLTIRETLDKQHHHYLQQMLSMVKRQNSFVGAIQTVSLLSCINLENQTQPNGW